MEFSELDPVIKDNAKRFLNDEFHASQKRLTDLLDSVYTTGVDNTRDIQMTKFTEILFKNTLNNWLEFTTKNTNQDSYNAYTTAAIQQLKNISETAITYNLANDIKLKRTANYFARHALANNTKINGMELIEKISTMVKSTIEK